MTTTMEALQLSEDQQKAQDALLEFWEDHEEKKLITLGGYAGTGKTTLIANTAMILTDKAASKSDDTSIIKEFSIAFCSYTGRAASVLRQKIARLYELDEVDYCGTIHRLIYKPVTDEDGNIIEWRKKDAISQDLIIIDEASMVSEQIFKDLAAYGKPIIAVGDHGQLPPINSSFNLMEKPDIRLEKIHRQAENNPIIHLSMMARKRQEIPLGSVGKDIYKTNDKKVASQIKNVDEVLFLCGFNFTRVMLNSYVRKRLNFHDPEPVVGDKVICLKNNAKKEIYNGMTGIIKKIKESGDYWYRVKILMDNGGAGQVFEGEILKAQFGQRYTIKEMEGLGQMEFGDLFDFGYAMTVHKAQGSEAKNVILYEQKLKKMSEEEYARWLYTGITRASEKLIIVGE